MILIEVSFLIALIYGVVFSASVEFNFAAKQFLNSDNNKVTVKGSADTKFLARGSVKSAEHKEKPWPEQLHQRFSYKTTSPMKIESEKARVYETEGNPLTTTITQNRYLTMINNDVEVAMFPVGDAGKYLSGGVLGKDSRYKFYKLRFVWSNDTTVPAASIVDGIGAPLEIIAIYYKEEYESFGNALSHPDGLAIYTVRVPVKEDKLNPMFDKMKPFLKAIEEADQSVMVSIEVASWFKDCIKAPYYYYAYPGSYTDFKTNKQYYSATIIVHPLRPEICSISREQFQVFLQFRNKQGIHFNNRESTYDRNDRPVVVATATEYKVLKGKSKSAAEHKVPKSKSKWC